MTFIGSHCNDRSADGPRFSFGIFVNKCCGIPTNCTRFLLADLTLENRIAALSTYLPPRCCTGTQLRLSPGSVAFLAFLFRLILPGGGVGQQHSGTSQDGAAEENEEMCPVVIGLLSSLYIPFPFLLYQSPQNFFFKEKK